MVKLSICIICKNEDEVIESCLKSVSWADEIIIVDSGSTDQTLDIAKRYTDKVFFNKWPGFGPQRQKAEKLASNEWIFAIDCDEVVTNELRQEIQSLLKSDSMNKENVYYVNRLTKLFGKFIRYGEMHPDRIGRIYNKNHTGYDDILVHEKVKIKNCKVIHLKNKLLHYYKSTYEDYCIKLYRYAEDSAEDKFIKGKRSNYIDATYRAFHAFVKNYIFKLGFLDGVPGFKIAWARVVYTYNKYNLLIKKYKV